MSIPTMSPGLLAHYLGEPLPAGVTLEDLRAEQLQLEAAQAAEAASPTLQPAVTPLTEETNDVPGNNGSSEQPRKRG